MDNRYKSYCSGDCTDCNSLNIVKSAERWCYEDKFGLKLQAKKMTYYSQKKRHTLATGVIEHQTHHSGSDPDGAYSWEKNINPVDYTKNDNLSYLLQEVCKTLQIDYKRFMHHLNKIYNEMGSLNESGEF